MQFLTQRSRNSASVAHFNYKNKKGSLAPAVYCTLIYQVQLKLLSVGGVLHRLSLYALRVVTGLDPRPTAASITSVITCNSLRPEDQIEGRRDESWRLMRLIPPLQPPALNIPRVMMLEVEG